jgi:hypothetical protein
MSADAKRRIVRDVVVAEWELRGPTARTRENG